MTAYTRDTIRDIIGKEVGVSDWETVTQAMVDTFATLTKDHQFIHVDPERAKSTPFGGTIAHGFLTLSLLGGMSYVAQYTMAGATMGMNYGFDKIRFLTPVRTGSRIRGRFVLKAMEERKPGQWIATLEATVEIEGSDKPAVIADWLTLTFVAQ
jgi:acyl dehydratase